ncbi:MAG: carboxypeptidase M32 [Rhodospirillaceae bacterium]|nr:carboxypeptidase M32 [Rhodospirillaceae bacterium]
MPATAYSQLESRFRRMALLSEAAGVLHWDAAAIMPDGGAPARSEQLAELKAVVHGLMTAPDMGDLISDAEAASGDLDDWQRANLREISHQWIKSTALPEDLVVALSRACSACETVWRGARAQSDFTAVKPLLQEVLNLTREAGFAKAEATGLSLFDALLDDYEPGGRCADIDVIFGELETFLPGFLQDVLEHQAQQPAAILPEGPFPVETQKALGEKFMTALGFDFGHGRLDVSLHPFCGGIPEDVRITTRYDQDDFTSSLMGVLHETGHALYERGLPERWRRQPVGEALGMSIHESQSLLVEMQVCRSRTFLNWAAPIMRDAFSGGGPAWDIDNLHRLYTCVQPGFIRVDADEVTYPAHVILRYRLERALLGEDLSLDDLPAAWNDGMKELLGIVPANDAEGCLQDVHWYDGAWGYFPTYTLGAMTAAQLYAAARDADPGIATSIGQGDFAPLMAWLRTHVHGKARLMHAPELLTEATSRPLDPAVFKAHLQARYLP